MSLLGNVGADLVAEYEKLAGQFYDETRYMAPGKDRPGLLSPLDYQDAQTLLCKLWDMWQQKNIITAELEELKSRPWEVSGDGQERRCKCCGFTEHYQ